MKGLYLAQASGLAVAIACAGWAGMASAQATGAATPAPAQAAPAAEATNQNVGEIVVTGSFIKGAKEDGALPVDVIGAEELSQRGAPTLVQFIKTIPSSGSVLGENNRFGGGNGTSTVNLRNLGNQRTLVLLNGRRIEPTARSGNGVDVNMLPSNAIQRVEVLKDGAAATYGSDAIGGVVNFITRSDLNGLELTGQYQGIQGSQGDYNLGAAWGWKGDRGNILLTANYRGRSELPVAKRDWALLTGPQGYLKNPLGGWSGTGNPGAYGTTTTAPTGNQTTGFGTGVGGSPVNQFTGPTLADIGCAANGGAPYSGVTASNTACLFQYTSFDNLVEVEQNLQTYGQLNFNLTDRVRFHSELIYAYNNTPHQSWAVTGPNQWPAPIEASGGSLGGGLSPIAATGVQEQSRFYIPNTNPGLLALVGQVNGANCSGATLPYGTTAANCLVALTGAQAAAANAANYGVAPSQTGWRPIGFGGDPTSSDLHDHYSYKSSTFRIQGGFDGEFEGGTNWNASLLYQNVNNNTTLSDISVNRLQLALEGLGGASCGTTDVTKAGTGSCFYFNPFSNASSVTLSGGGANPYGGGSASTYGLTGTAATNYSNATAQRAAVVAWMQSPQHTLTTNQLFVADAGLSGKSPWTLWAKDPIAWATGIQYRYDRVINKPDALYDANATPCVDSVPYGDGTPYCPTTGNGPFLFNANQRPLDVQRKIEAAYVEVRLPVLDTLDVTLAGRGEKYVNVGSTFNPKLSVRWQAVPWLAFRGSVGNTYRAPTGQQVQDTFTRGLTAANGTWHAVDTHGNPNLKAETADTYAAGLIFNKGPVTASIDYWDFNFKNPITTESTADLVKLMFPAASGTGNCGVAGFEALQGKFTFDSAQGCAYSSILAYSVKNINGGAVKTDGIDYQINYDAGHHFNTDWNAGFDGSYLLDYNQSPYSIAGHATSTGVINYAGSYRSSTFTSYARLRSNIFVNAAFGKSNIRWQTRYVSATRQVDSLSTIAAFSAYGATTKVPAYIQHDVTYRYDINDKTTVSLTVQNVFDKSPPFAFGTQYNYDASTVNPLGRVYQVSLRKKF
jgi:iron complex outermembrane receptor protein